MRRTGKDVKSFGAAAFLRQGVLSSDFHLALRFVEVAVAMHLLTPAIVGRSQDIAVLLELLLLLDAILALSFFQQFTEAALAAAIHNGYVLGLIELVDCLILPLVYSRQMIGVR